MGQPNRGEIPADLPSYVGPALGPHDVEDILPLATGCLLLAYIEGVSAGGKVRIRRSKPPIFFATPSARSKSRIWPGSKLTDYNAGGYKSCNDRICRSSRRMASNSAFHPRCARWRSV